MILEYQSAAKFLLRMRGRHWRSWTPEQVSRMQKAKKLLKSVVESEIPPGSVQHIAGSVRTTMAGSFYQKCTRCDATLTDGNVEDYFDRPGDMGWREGCRVDTHAHGASMVLTKDFILSSVNYDIWAVPRCKELTS